MTISIIHPSRGRAAQALKTARKWISSAKDKNRIEYLLSLDEDDTARTQYEALFEDMHLLRCYAHNANAVQAINHAARLCTGDLFIVVSDDFDCPFHWDEGLQQMLDGKEDFLVKTKDGLQPFLITLPIMDRKYYERFGYIYNPLYRHMFCDTEMTAVGWMLDRIITLDITFPHLHYSTGKSPRDAVSSRNDSTWQYGQQLYHKRRAVNFDLTSFVKTLSCTCPMKLSVLICTLARRKKNF